MYIKYQRDESLVPVPTRDDRSYKLMNIYISSIHSYFMYQVNKGKEPFMHVNLQTEYL
jgi:hypothetical protein